jgi:uncharacterized protein YodC (DUF2158 family)
MNTLKVGDVVHLKSGGPQMTVCSIDFDKKDFKCCWFNGNKVEKSNFPLDTVVETKETVLNNNIDIY